MNFFDSQLEKLINNESFIRWIRGEANEEEAEAWERWYNSKEKEHTILVKKAKKILNMPFINTKCEQAEVESELTRLRNSLLDKKS